jgi:WD40 repeat protein
MYFILRGENNGLEFWDVSTTPSEHAFTIEGRFCGDFASSGDGQYVAAPIRTGPRAMNILIWKIEDRSQHGLSPITVISKSDIVECVIKFGSSEKLFLFSGKTIELWTVTAGELQLSFSALGTIASSLLFRNQLLFHSVSDDFIRIMDEQSLSEIGTLSLRGLRSDHKCRAAPDETCLVYYGGWHIQILDAELCLQAEFTLEDIYQLIDVVFSNDSKLIAVLLNHTAIFPYQSVIQVFSTGSGSQAQPVLQLDCLRGCSLRSINFVPDDSSLIGISLLEIKSWDLVTAEEIEPPFWLPRRRINWKMHIIEQMGYTRSYTGML